jgi:F-type H+/Na+-transporting ATPase subunit alpha
LEENSVGVIILGDFLSIQEGDEVRALGRLLSVPVGDAVVGRVSIPWVIRSMVAGPVNAPSVGMWK